MSRFTLIDRKPAPQVQTPPSSHPDRREALAWLASGVSVAMASCGKPSSEIVPQVAGASSPGSGAIERYATSLPLGGYGRGMIVTTRDGRPTKIEGDPRNPFSLGATDVFAEAEVLSLYDPGRARGVQGPTGPVDWSAFSAAWATEFVRLRANGGEGFTLVTPRVTSPTELRLITALQAALPRMVWRRFQAINDDNADAGAELAFGRRFDASLDLSALKTLLCLDADPLGPGERSLANARAYSRARDPAQADSMLRLYAAEPAWSLTGMNADHRLAVSPGEAGEIAVAVANGLGAGLRGALLTPQARRFADAALSDLQSRGGGVLAGRSQPPAVHALVHWINRSLRAPVQAIQPVDPHPALHADSCRAFLADLQAGRVTTLVCLGGDPAAAFDLPTARAFTTPHLRIAAVERPNATSSLAAWTLALTHPLESWGDLRGPDGSAAPVQPMIRPLHDGRTVGQVLNLLLQRPAADARSLVMESWTTEASDPESRFRQSLSDGRLAPASVAATLPPARAPQAPPPPASRPGFELTLSPDPMVYDGAYADNAWLQECPKPLTHETWGASLCISPADAGRLGVKTGDHLHLQGLEAPVPVRVVYGQAPGVLSAHLGGGRRAGGPISRGVGVDFTALRGGVGEWVIPLGGVSVARARGAPPSFSQTARLEGDERRLSPIVMSADLPRLPPIDHTPVKPPSLFSDPPPYAPAWGMVIDAAACIGCSACVVACQAENNVPVVGPAEVALGRDMHWLRIDTYDLGSETAPQPAFQPVPCMQCEHAPCEPVCPVEASVHDHEGLNDQVYNRCIGTRFCEANCPYKVRRFNFHGYSHEQAYENLGDDSFAGQKNPEVTVRSRGVMEKCTYCVQRISYARRDAEKQGRSIAEGEVVTACQSACPTRAIHFGDLTNPTSDVATLRTQARHYALLGELGTRPRTTYLARLRNPNPRLEAANAGPDVAT